MYTLDYLNCFIENLDLPEASRASLREKLRDGRDDTRRD